MPNRAHLSVILPIGVLVLVTVVIFLLYAFKPTAKRGAAPKVVNVTVATRVLAAKPYTVVVESFGRLNAKTRTELRPQVAGKIVFLSESFNDGGYIKKGEILASIEKADFEIALTQAEATHLDAKRLLDEETARAQQAKEDWQSLGRPGEPAPLVLRQPQIDSAKARLKSAQAVLAGAELNLSRTDIRAPYDGRVISRSANLFQTVSVNSVLGEIFSTDALEIRLPIKNSDISFINTSQLNNPSQVTIITTNQQAQNWPAKVVRSSANIDEQTRQPFVVAQISNAFSKDLKGRQPLRLGQYVKALIDGKTLDDAIVINNNAIYQGAYVYLYKDDKVYRRDINVLWQNDRYAVISQGLSAGDEIVTSPLGKITSGTRVQHEKDVNKKGDTNKRTQAKKQNNNNTKKSERQP